MEKLKLNITNIFRMLFVANIFLFYLIGKAWGFSKLEITLSLDTKITLILFLVTVWLHAHLIIGLCLFRKIMKKEVKRAALFTVICMSFFIAFLFLLMSEGMVLVFFYCLLLFTLIFWDEIFSEPGETTFIHFWGDTLFKND